MKKLIVAVLKYSLLTVIINYSLLTINSVAHPVNAQQISLSLSPPLVEIMVKPGKGALIAYDLKNVGDPTAVETLVRPFTAGAENGTIDIQPEFSEPVIFTLENSEIELGDAVFLKSNQQQQYLLRISIPDDCPEGDYYYSFLVRTQPQPGIEGRNSTLAQGTIGANLLITVTGTGVTDTKGGISLFNVMSRFKLNFFGKTIRLFDSGDPVPVILTVRNRGRNLVKAEGTITLSGAFGTRADYEVAPRNILSQAQRTLEATPSADLDFRQWGQKPTLLIDGFHIGRYRLDANLVFGDNLYADSAAADFIALPLKFGLGLLAAVFISLLVIRRMRYKNE